MYEMIDVFYEYFVIAASSFVRVISVGCYIEVDSK